MLVPQVWLRVVKGIWSATAHDYFSDQAPMCVFHALHCSWAWKACHTGPAYCATRCGHRKQCLLIWGPAASLLVSSSSTNAEEVLLVLNGGILEGCNCLEAIARGSGAEIFTWNSKLQLVAVTGECLSLVGGGSRS